jgi:hypothetical protein
MNKFINKQVGVQGAKKMRITIDSVEFVKTWMTSKTVSEVAEKLDLNKTQVSSKANNLRSLGVKLPNKRVQAEDSIEALNQIVARYTK